MVGLLQHSRVHNNSMVHLGFVVNEVFPANVLHRELQVSPASIIQPLHRTHSFTSHQICVFLPTESFVKHHTFNPLNPELNPICHLLALLEAHHILHVSRIRVKACWYEYNRMFSFLLLDF